MSAPAGYRLVFADEFSTLSIADTASATANWYSAQAWNRGGFGDATFMPASGARSPFAIAAKGGETALKISLTRNAEGRLESGLISNTFPDGGSRTPQDGNAYGYYETRLWLPTGRGIWPAFWAMEKERLSSSRDHVHEIDVIEQHGSAAADRFGSNLHDWDWNGASLTGHSDQPLQTLVASGSLSSGWHVFGVEIRPDVTIFTMDGAAYRRLATPATLDSDPMFMINLAVGGGWPVDPALNRAELFVDYFRAYELSQAPNPLPEILIGTSGNDTYQVRNSATQIREAANGGYDTVHASVSYRLPNAVEKLVLAEGGSLSGTGNAGDNHILGNGSANQLSGLDGADRLEGLGGKDTLLGGAGADTLFGGAGDDILAGDGGADRLQGDAGIDTFTFRLRTDSFGAAHDTIVDFEAVDRIDLRAIDANELLAGNQVFVWVGAQPLTGAGQVRFERGILSADVNGDRQPDFSVDLNVLSLSAGQILL